MRLPDEVDVVVVGSGGAGLTAALAAAVAGVEVLPLEASTRGHHGALWAGGGRPGWLARLPAPGPRRPSG